LIRRGTVLGSRREAERLTTTLGTGDVTEVWL